MNVHAFIHTANLYAAIIPAGPCNDNLLGHYMDVYFAASFRFLLVFKILAVLRCSAFIEADRLDES